LDSLNVSVRRPLRTTDFTFESSEPARGRAEWFALFVSENFDGRSREHDDVAAPIGAAIHSLQMTEDFER